MKQAWGFSNLGHYPYHCLIMVNMGQQEIATALKRRKYKIWAKAVLEEDVLFEPKYGGYAMGCSKEDDYGYKQRLFFISLNNFKLDDKGFVTLAHECFHIVQFVSDHVNADLIDEKESSAYLHGYLMSACIKVIRGK